MRERLIYLGILFALGGLFPESNKVVGVQSQISEICEQWFLQERDGKERIIAHTLLFLLIKSNQLNAQSSDLKRLYVISSIIGSR
jgi:hypothetical protein